MKAVVFRGVGDIRLEGGPPQAGGFPGLQPVADAIDAYHHFDRHERGWAKVELIPPAVH